MTNYNERLDEILTHFRNGTTNPDPKKWAMDEADLHHAKQAILDWHNKQVEKAMAKFSLKKGVKYDVKATDSVIVITPSNKLKESEL